MGSSFCTQKPHQNINRRYAETLEVQGEIREMKHDLINKNQKGISKWFEWQNQYSTKDAEYELREEQLPFKLVDLVSSSASL